MNRFFASALFVLLALAGIAARADAPAPAPAQAPAPASAPAPNLELSVDAIVKRASGVIARKPQKLACVVNLKAVQLDSDGKPTETQESELVATWDKGVEDEGIPYKRSTDGKPYTAEEMKKADTEDQNKRVEMKQHQDQGEGASMDSPLEGKQIARHVFALVKRETLDGRDAYVVSVKPLNKRRDETAMTREGTIWIDAKTFLPFYSQTHASPLPKHVEKMELDEEYALTAQGEAAPKSLKLDVAGGFLFIHRAYKIDTTWRDCK